MYLSVPNSGRTFPVIKESVWKWFTNLPTSDRLPDVKFGVNLDVLAEITACKNHYWKSDQSQDSLQNDESSCYRSVSICKTFIHLIYLDIIRYQL